MPNHAERQRVTLRRELRDTVRSELATKLGIPTLALTTRVRKGGRDRLTVYVHPEVVQAMRTQALEERTSMSELIEQAMIAYLDLPDPSPLVGAP